MATVGVGGGIVTISPGKDGLGAFAPLLDPAGNSVKGQRSQVLLKAGGTEPVRLGA